MTTQQSIKQYKNMFSKEWQYGLHFRQNILVKDLHAGEETRHSRLRCSLGLEAVAFYLELLLLLVFVFFVTKGTITITFFR